MKQFKLTWDAPANNGGAAITDYVIQYKVSGDPTWITYADDISTATSGIISSGTTECNIYEFRVAALNVFGTGNFSSTATKALSFVPSGVSNIQIEQSGEYINATWTAPTDNGGCDIIDYVVQYSGVNDSAWTTIDEGVSTNTYVSASGFISDTYYFRIVPVNVAGQGEIIESSGLIYVQPTTTTTTTTTTQPPTIFTFTGADLVSGTGTLESPLIISQNANEAILTLAQAGTATVVVDAVGTVDDDTSIYLNNTLLRIMRGNEAPYTVNIPETGPNLSFVKMLNVNHSKVGGTMTATYDPGTIPSISGVGIGPSPSGADIVFSQSTNGSPILSYQAQFSEDGISNWSDVIISGYNLSSARMEINDPSIVYGNTYFYRVRIENYQGVSEYSNILSIAAGERYVDTRFGILGIGTSGHHRTATSSSQVTGTNVPFSISGVTFAVYAPVSGTFFTKFTSYDAQENDLYPPADLNGTLGSRINQSIVERSFTTSGGSGLMSIRWTGGGGISEIWFEPS